VQQRNFSIFSHASSRRRDELNYAPGHTSRTDLANLAKGGIGAVAFAIAVGPGPRTPQGVKAARAEANAKLAWIRGFIRDHPKEVALALTAEDIERIRRPREQYVGMGVDLENTGIDVARSRIELGLGRRHREGRRSCNRHNPKHS
jgi:hypothetical protein